ncbi:MAG: hypothetical protein UR28_C0002G0018 [Candidatus Peregrinibacteria bacterium GW2011_GWF2_33_10]|nr:MAG: hypothetical protein UR28_C0002G0018 [Candidatus Peregrinibacteria bacterium GW2011_GWF2_33_10]OGJ45599.1 MAG: hypothetical protein A2263_00660 [Candidatus Peregrinibacteria bacterium RIFOXYA2_FULL_33_21]OGJ51072.1 MAG: hypothetical protein A2307_06350 [Candidatus Peregrinibacteria bacterium RIFOXYB2_FULL_33_20]
MKFDTLSASEEKKTTRAIATITAETYPKREYLPSKDNVKAISSEIAQIIKRIIDSIPDTDTTMVEPITQFSRKEFHEILTKYWQTFLIHFKKNLKAFIFFTGTPIKIKTGITIPELSWIDFENCYIDFDIRWGNQNQGIILFQVQNNSTVVYLIVHPSIKPIDPKKGKPKNTDILVREEWIITFFPNPPTVSSKKIIYNWK